MNPTVKLSAPSVGSVVKKMMAINPELSAQDLIEIVKHAVYSKGGDADGFSKTELVDEDRALELARASLTGTMPIGDQQHW